MLLLELNVVTAWKLHQLINSSIYNTTVPMWLCCHPSDGQTPAFKDKKKCMKPKIHTYIRTTPTRRAAEPLWRNGGFSVCDGSHFLIFRVCGLVCMHIVCTWHVGSSGFKPIWIHVSKFLDSYCSAIWREFLSMSHIRSVDICFYNFML